MVAVLGKLEDVPENVALGIGYADHGNGIILFLTHGISPVGVGFCIDIVCFQDCISNLA
jgi:hypothetical protein